MGLLRQERNGEISDADYQEKSVSNADDLSGA